MSIKILLADDSITIQKVISIIFGGSEYELTVVDNGRASVEKSSEVHPDVLLIDAVMPGMSGYEVCEIIRSTPTLSSTPILLLTGSFEPFDENRAKSCGADDYLAKPFESQQIINKVHELYELGRNRSSISQLAYSDQQLDAVPPVTAPEPSFNSMPDDIWGSFSPAPELQPDTLIEATSLVTPPPLPTLSAPEPSPWGQFQEPAVEMQQPVTTLPETEPLAFESPALTAESLFGDASFGSDADLQPAGQAFPSCVDMSPQWEATPLSPEPAIDVCPPDSYVQSAVEAASPEPESIPSPAVQLSEEQLRAAILGASRDVIERIVWEVVPDLAEAMIRDAIRKIKEGV